MARRLTIVKICVKDGVAVVEVEDIVALSKVEEEMFGEVLQSKGYKLLPTA